MSDLVPPTGLIRPVTPQIPAGMDAERARRVAEDFEVSFLSAMLQPMFAGLSTEAPFGGGAGEATWRSFLVDAMARQTVRSGGIGVSDAIQRELVALQAAAEPETPAPEEAA